MLSTKPAALILHDFSSIRCWLRRGAYFLSPCPGPPQVNDHHCYNVTCDNFFTSLDVAQRLAEQKCSIVGTVRQNRRELPPTCKKNQKLHETSIFTRTQSGSTVTLTSYDLSVQKAKIGRLMSTLNPNVEIPFQKNPKKKPEAVVFYYKTKSGVDVQWRIQKILVGGDLKHKTSKFRMSSPKLRVIFRPKSEIRTFFSPIFRWSPKKKSLHQNFE